MMKKNIFLLFLALLPFLGLGQAIVSDPILQKFALEESIARKSATTNTLKQLSEAYKQTTELSKSAAFLKKQYDRLHEVNMFITNLSRLERMVTKQERLIMSTKEIVTDLEMSKLYTLEEVNMLHRSFSKMISTTNDIVEMLDIILKPKSAMSDGERMMLLRQMEEDFKERQAMMDKTIWEFRRVRNQRLLNDTLKKMHKN